LIEVPMGTTIREIVEEIGGGVRPGRRFKAVQIGGPSGGCVPARLADTPIDFESLREVGAIMGSGGLVVLDDSACMVDMARYFLQFTEAQSCGKCTSAGSAPSDAGVARPALHRQGAPQRPRRTQAARAPGRRRQPLRASAGPRRTRC